MEQWERWESERALSVGVRPLNPLFVNILRISPLPAIFCGDHLLSKLGKYRRINNLAASTKKAERYISYPAERSFAPLPLAHSVRGRRWAV
jgi:hypothetical protein